VRVSGNRASGGARVGPGDDGDTESDGNLRRIGRLAAQSKVARTRLFGDEVSNGSEMCLRCTSLLAGALGYLIEINFREVPMTKTKARVSRKNKSEPSLAEQRAALEQLRDLVRQIETERADGMAGSPHKRGRKKTPFKAA
jgi:hypothetical protein